MTPQPANISVTLPVSQAIDRVKRVLFQPFDIGKWFVIGFCAWLALLGEGGGGGGGNVHVPGGGHDGGNVAHELERAKGYIMDNLYWLVPVVVAVVVFCVGLWLLFTWLSSRGRFMFLHCVALDKAEVVKPWGVFRHAGNSLFIFRVMLGLIGAVVMLPLLALAAYLIFGMVSHGRPDIGAIFIVSGLAFVFIVAAIVLFLISKLTTDFVVPIMFVRGGTCLAGWRELRALISANVGHFVLYLLFQIVLSLVLGAIVFAFMIVTCCFCCLLLVPYVGTVVLLPVFVFKRAYSIHYLAQFGPDYDVFPPAAVPAPAA